MEFATVPILVRQWDSCEPDCQLSTPELKFLLLYCAKQLGYIVEENMKPKLQYLEKRLPISPIELEKMVYNSLSSK